jgi:gas vesicle protein
MEEISMIEDNEYQVGPVLLFFLAGCVIGAGAALLLAPQSGEKTRTMLKDYAKDAQDKALEKARQAKDTFDTAIEQGKQFVNEKKAVLAASVEAGREAMEAVKNEATRNDRTGRIPQGV